MNDEHLWETTALAPAPRGLVAECYDDDTSGVDLGQHTVPVVALAAQTRTIDGASEFREVYLIATRAYYPSTLEDYVNEILEPNGGFTKLRWESGDGLETEVEP